MKAAIVVTHAVVVAGFALLLGRYISALPPTVPVGGTVGAFVATRTLGLIVVMAMCDAGILAIGRALREDSVRGTLGAGPIVVGATLLVLAAVGFIGLLLVSFAQY